MKKNIGKVPLERALSKLGLASRSQTREWILAGRIEVNGKRILNPHLLVIPEKDQFILDRKPLRRSPWQTILLYKPKAVVTTRSDERGRRTVLDLLPDELKHLHPVGRLDMASTGLLLLTNDTKLSAFLTDPTNAILRVYAITVAGKVTLKTIQKARQGVFDRGEFLKPSTVSLRKASHKESHLIVELTEGKNREIRRLFQALGHEVTHLKRIAFGPLELGDLTPGEFRYLSAAELKFRK